MLPPLPGRDPLVVDVGVKTGVRVRYDDPKASVLTYCRCRRGAGALRRPGLRG